MPRVSGASRFSAAITAVLVMAVVGALAGFGWLLVAEPARWTYLEQGLVLDESAAGEQFGIVAWFVLIGVVLSLIFGAILAFVRPDDGWVLVPVVIAATLVGALVCSRVGYSFGPADPQSITGLQVGDRVPMRFDLAAFSPMLVWSLAGLIGVAAATYLRAPQVSERSEP